MISRTVLEWRKIRYGDGPDEIPEWAADRLASVARANPLGGEEGARILQHGRTSLRAQQVVGVIAAEDCTLEILPKIDGLGDGDSAASQAQIRRNLVHMLAVALDLDIASGQMARLGWQDENLLEVLIRLFCDRLFEAVHLGLPRRYVAMEEDIPTLRGRLDVIRQFSTLAASPDRLACRFDELSSDIPLNQIMKAAVARLLQLSRSTHNQRRLGELAFAFAEVSDVPVQSLRWDSVILDRTNARWKDLLELARLLLGERFQTTTSGRGQGFSLLFEMNTLFEEFVGRTLRRALVGTGLQVDLQGGRLHCLAELDEEYAATGRRRFMTKPDIMIRRGSERVMIIDTKWKRLAPSIDDPKQGVSQSDVYQMMAYGRIYQCPNLMLLYPHHDGMRIEAGITSRHEVVGCDDQLATTTLDLSQLAACTPALRSLICRVADHISEEAAVGP
ncbi:McrC family protein [Qipengyuania gaetbuli]|uniref:McrC family protein n=1 Tax=Qipengyuania gaetbuli TaxID=266952 RepID=UPI001C997091|nr:McrC family protein [Qipengyuania gaetbuli]MBY6014699.1 McrC family protein [Qipengyuania gaetbuli]